MAVCVDCGQKISLARGLLGQARCPACTKKHNEAVAAERARELAERDENRHEYASALKQLRRGADLAAILARIAAKAQQVTLSDNEIAALNAEAFAKFFDEVVADDIVTPEEDRLLVQAGQGLGLRLTMDQWVRYTVAACNAGVMPTVEEPQIILNAGETDYFECQARLLTNRVITEHRTNFNSISFPVGRSGVRYRVGQGRGRTVVVGTRTEEQDRGILAITSQRTVFAGANRVQEYRHNRCVGLRCLGTASPYKSPTGSHSPRSRQAVASMKSLPPSSTPLWVLLAARFTLPRPHRSLQSI